MRGKTLRPEQEAIRPGVIWRRKKSGALVRIVSAIDTASDWNTTAYFDIKWETVDERLATVERMVLSSGEASRCFIENHASLKDEVAWLHRRSDRYRTAWLSARRRVHPRRFIAGYRAMVADDDERREQDRPQTALAAPLSASGAEGDHGGRRDGEGLA